MAKPTTASKGSFIATVHPHFGLDTHSQRGCHSLRRHASGGLRGGLPPRTPGPDSTRQTPIQAVAIPFEKPLTVSV